MALQRSLADARQHFAEELRVVAHVQDERVLDAFATVPRERFVGPGPWRVFHEGDGYYWSTPDADPRWLYHNVLIALDESRGLNTGQPSLWAHQFDRIGIRHDDRVLQIGSGSGYFTAILAELVGAKGQVLGLEVDTHLAEAAQKNLQEWPNTSIQLVEGVAPLEDKWDVVIAFAGVTAPPSAWLDALSERGRALIPLTGSQRWGMFLRIDRHDRGFAARYCGWCGFYPCVGARNDAEAEALGRALGDPAGQRAIRWLRRDEHQAEGTCWLHGDGWCLSKRELH